MPIRVLLMRHAETARPDVFHGFESDIDLGRRGELQAMAVAPVVAAYRPNVIVSSAMLRARRTAQEIHRICGPNVPWRIEEQLHERKVGSLQGTPVRGEVGVWPATLQKWMDGETGYAPVGMESYDDMTARLIPVWRRITTEYADRTVVVVCHGIVCRVILLNILEGYNVRDWPKLGRIGNGSITELIGDGTTWRAERIGYVPEEVRSVDETEGPPPGG